MFKFSDFGLNRDFSSISNLCSLDIQLLVANFTMENGHFCFQSPIVIAAL